MKLSPSSSLLLSDNLYDCRLFLWMRKHIAIITSVSIFLVLTAVSGEGVSSTAAFCILLAGRLFRERYCLLINREEAFLSSPFAKSADNDFDVDNRAEKSARYV